MFPPADLATDLLQETLSTIFQIRKIITRPGRPHIPSQQAECTEEAFFVVGIPCGALAQLGERLICIQEVIGSIPIGSTNPLRWTSEARQRLGR